MGLIDWIILLAIAAVAGSLGQAIAGYSLGGCVVSIVVGFIGALIGFWLSRSLGLPEPFLVNIGGQPFPILWSIIGSTLFTLIISLIRRRRI